MHARTITAAACAIVGLALSAPPVLAATAPSPSSQSAGPGVVVAQDVRATITAKATAPGAVTVTTAPNTRVSVVPAGRTQTTQGQPLNKITDRSGSAVFTSLNPGTTYSILTPDAMTEVTVVGRAGEARALTVTTTERTGEVRLAWNFAPSRGSKARPQFRIEARPDASGQPTLVDQVSTTSMTMSGLDANLRYLFRVTPFNSLGDGVPTSARMTRSLAEVAGRSVSLEPAPIPAAPSIAPPPAPIPVATPSPNPTSEPAAVSSPQPISNSAPSAPRTKTIYVCPDGFGDAGANCRKTAAYTYSTRSYTYTYGKTGTETFVDTCSSGYTDDSGQFHWVEQPHPCQRSRDVYGNIKDATPAGWTDTGSAWSKKDDAPAGWSDDGAQYVQTADKVAKEVPA